MTGRSPFSPPPISGDSVRVRGNYFTAAVPSWEEIGQTAPVVFPVLHGVQPHAGLFGAMEPNYMLPSER